MATCGVYIITNTINQKTYIGSSVNIERRWRHNYNSHLTNAFNKYGRDNFSFEILCNCKPDREDLIYFEQKCMDLFCPEYNKRATADSNLGVKRQPLTDEHKLKISKSHTGKIRGPFSREWRDNLSKSHMGHKGTNTGGRKHSAESKLKMSISKLGNKHCAGRIASEETRLKMSKSIRKALASKKNDTGWKVG